MTPNEPARTLSDRLKSWAEELTSMGLRELYATGDPTHARKYIDMARDLLRLRIELGATDFEEPPDSIDGLRRRLSEEGIA